MIPTLSRRFAAEFLGTSGLLMAVVGSGIMGERLSGGNLALALLANSLATGAALVALILCCGPISGAHFNPAVTFCAALQKNFSWRTVPFYVASQITGVADHWRVCRSRGRSHHVRAAGVLGLSAHSQRSFSDFQ